MDFGSLKYCGDKQGGKVIFMGIIVRFYSFKVDFLSAFDFNFWLQFCMGFELSYLKESEKKKTV